MMTVALVAPAICWNMKSYSTTPIAPGEPERVVTTLVKSTPPVTVRWPVIVTFVSAHAPLQLASGTGTNSTDWTMNTCHNQTPFVQMLRLELVAGLEYV